MFLLVFHCAYIENSVLPLIVAEIAVMASLGMHIVPILQGLKSQYHPFALEGTEEFSLVEIYILPPITVGIKLLNRMWLRGAKCGSVWEDAL